MEGQMSLFNTPEVSGTSALKVSRDFGEHIGGARKELWSAGGINLEDLLDMNDAEKSKFVKKDNIWKMPWQWNVIWDQARSKASVRHWRQGL